MNEHVQCLRKKAHMTRIIQPRHGGHGAVCCRYAICGKTNLRHGPGKNRIATPARRSRPAGGRSHGSVREIVDHGDAGGLAAIHARQGRARLRQRQAFGNQIAQVERSGIHHVEQRCEPRRAEPAHAV